MIFRYTAGGYPHEEIGLMIDLSFLEVGHVIEIHRDKIVVKKGDIIQRIEFRPALPSHYDDLPTVTWEECDE